MTFSAPARPALLASLLALAAAPSAAADTLLAHDFDTPATRWPEMFTDASGPTVFAEAAWASVPGHSSTTSPGLVITMDTTAGNTRWETFVVSGALAVKNTEASLARLSLAFTLSASSALPVIIRIESLDASRNRTGGLERRIKPATPAAPDRHALALDTFKPFGEGAFDPAAPFVQIIVATDHEWPASLDHRLTLDDLRYAATPGHPATTKAAD